MKKIITFILSLAILTTICAPAFASDEGTIAPHLVMRETVGYDPDMREIDWQGIRVGSVSGDNSNSSTPLTLSFTYDYTGSVTGQFSAEVSGKPQANFQPIFSYLGKWR